jgi:hypothetical protein
VSRLLSNQIADLVTNKPGGADAGFSLAAYDIVSVKLKVKRQCATSTKALGSYSCGRYDSGVVTAENLSEARVNETNRRGGGELGRVCQ